MNVLKTARVETVDIEAFFWQPKNPRFSTYIHVSQPTPLEERNLGQFFIICEISNQNKENQDMIATIIEELESHYYGTNEIEQSKALEIALHEANKKIAQLVNEYGSSLLKDLNMAAGVCHGSKISFAEAGQIHAYLIHQDKIIDLLEKNGAHQINNPLRTFSNILSGKVEGEDAFVMCTSSLLDYLSLEKLKRLIKEQKTARKAVSELEKLLLNDSTRETTFATLILKSSPANREKMENNLPGVNIHHQPHHPNYSSQRDSMERLIEQEQRTTELLTPSVWPNLKKMIQSMKENMTQKKETRIETEKEEIAPTELKATTPRTLPSIRPVKQKFPVKQGLLTILAYLKTILGKLLNLVADTWHSLGRIKKKNEITTTIKNLPYRTNRTISKGILNFKNLTRKRKMILLLAVVLIIVFSWSVSFFGSKKELQKNLAQYEAQIQAASDKQLAAESNIIFNNETEARKLLVEARDILNVVPGNITELQGRIAEIKAKIDKTSREINKIIDVPEPKIVADLAQTAADFDSQWVVIEGNELYTFGKNASVMKTNATSSETKKLEVRSNNASAVVKVDSAGNGNFLLLHEDKTASLFATETDSLKTINLEKSPDNTNFKDFKIFNQRLYVLDPTANQIFKYNPGKENFAVAGPWVSDGQVGLQEATALAIDANIYVLQSDGSVTKLFGGVKQNFQVEKIEPSISSATAVITDENIQNIYIVDPNNKRMVIFNKEGKLTKQLTSEKFDNIKNVIVNEGGKKVYVLNGQKIFSIDL